MSRPHQLPILATVAVLSALVLTACGGGPEPTPSASPSDEPTPTATATEEPELHVSSIVIDRDSVYVTVTEGGILVDIPFSTDPVIAAAQLSEAIDLEPTTTVTPPGPCGGDLTYVTWGGITFISPYKAAPPGVQFYAQATAQYTNNGITVAMLSGQWVGYDGSDTIAANPSAPLIPGPGSQVLAYDVTAGTLASEPDDFYGASAVILDDAVESFSSPIHYYYDC